MIMDLLVIVITLVGLFNTLMILNIVRDMRKQTTRLNACNVRLDNMHTAEVSQNHEIHMVQNELRIIEDRLPMTTEARVASSNPPTRTAGMRASVPPPRTVGNLLGIDDIIDMLSRPSPPRESPSESVPVEVPKSRTEGQDRNLEPNI